ncbi:translocation/assembly module TamB domain-containing protein [Sulfitobacter aestuarii]|uniref:Translocation/assembly module TamB domain-containing protein n=1 Tax=Sulfitobacter aestuarii TaxID=2161676 RepID=A0ABW5TZK7_9RHOB
MQIFFRSLLAFLLACLTLTAPAVAQDDGKGFLTRKIQEALSGSGRDVSIDGFRGVLSSEASFDRMTIADEDGIWLTLEDVVLDWNRSALLRGRLEVEKLTAGRLDLPRLPVSEEDSLPEAEATPFSLPDLPVSIEIAEFAVEEIALGKPILGEAARLSVNANARYNDAAAILDFQARRIDGRRGEFDIQADFQRGDNVLDLLLHLVEEEGGIAAKLLNLPDQPSVEMRIAGQGPLDDFTTDVTIATDGAERLAGEVSLGTETPRRASDSPDRRIRADIGGDITALLAPRYREFFGEDVRLTIDALREGNGALEVSDFTLKARAAELAGRVNLNQENWPTFVDITGSVSNPDGTRVLLPVSGAGTSVARVGLSVDYDVADGDAFSGIFDLEALETEGLKIAETRLEMDGSLQGNLGSVGQFLGDLTFDANGLELSDPASAQALGSDISGKAHIEYIEGEPVRISDLDLSGADYGLTGQAQISGFDTGFLTKLQTTLKASDLGRFSALAGRELSGQSVLALEGEVTPLGGLFDLNIAGSTNNLQIGIEQADAVLAGLTELSLQARRNETGTFVRDLSLKNDAVSLTGAAELRSEDSAVEIDAQLADVSLVLPQYEGPIRIEATALQDTRGWTIDARSDGPYGAEITAAGLATGPDASLRFTAKVPELSRFTPEVSGALNAEGTLSQSPQGYVIDTTASGPYGAQAALEGLVTPMLDLSFDVSLPDLNPVVPQVNGPLQASGTLRQTEAGFFIDTQASGPYGSRAAVEGLATGPDMSLTFDVSVPNVQPLAPGISGPLQASGSLRQTPQGIAIDTKASGPYSANASVQGVVTGPDAAVEFSLSMPNIGVLVEKVNGPLSVTGSARKEGEAWRIDTSADGPSGTNAEVRGLVNPDGSLALDINGSAPLGLTKPFLAPRDLQGRADFDLSVNGPPRLSSVSGTISTRDARLTAPNLRLALEGISADIRLGNNRAEIDISGSALEGGRLRVGGSVVLTPSLPADLNIAVQGLVISDPRLYRTSVNGNLRLAGPLTGGAVISGQVDVGETDITVPSTGLTAIGDIPPITHVNDSAAVAQTRRKAGLNGEEPGDDAAAGGDGPGFGLDLRISAPNRIFVRGRGLDAELGGALTLTGTTNRIISAGRFELIRGRLDILGKRFDLIEGSIQFQGDLVPYIRFVTATESRSGEVRVIVEGPADEPEVSFEATPDAPQDEVLAQLLFGRNISEISAFQALQLASAVATLAGRGGGGIISNLRDGFGLDDLDVTTTDDGATAVRAGKYISENVYSDVTAASDGTGEVSLNLDITPSLTAKGTLGSDGDSGIGIFFERDY